MACVLDHSMVLYTSTYWSDDHDCDRVVVYLKCRTCNTEYTLLRCMGEGFEMDNSEYEFGPIEAESAYEFGSGPSPMVKYYGKVNV